jgi:hypothetical protein
VNEPQNTKMEQSKRLDPKKSKVCHQSRQKLQFNLEEKPGKQMH